MFTTQHYYLISRILRWHFTYINYSKLVIDFTKMFSEDNKQFDKEKFKEACIPLTLKMTHKKEYIKSGEEVSEYNKNYYQKHNGKLKEQANKRLAINPELNKDYYEKNREKILKQKREHYKKIKGGK